MNPKDAVCRSCGGYLKLVDVRDGECLVACVDCAESYLATSAPPDGGVIHLYPEAPQKEGGIREHPGSLDPGPSQRVAG